MIPIIAYYINQLKMIKGTETSEIREKKIVKKICELLTIVKV